MQLKFCLILTLALAVSLQASPSPAPKEGLGIFGKTAVAVGGIWAAKKYKDNRDKAKELDRLEAQAQTQPQYYPSPVTQVHIVPQDPGYSGPPPPSPIVTVMATTTVTATVTAMATQTVYATLVASDMRAIRQFESRNGLPSGTLPTRRGQAAMVVQDQGGVHVTQ
ncbi:hypothetical protein BJ684DRAFT_14589 [Piptocephalis cylindrospora]|uniref:Uncharacterized protein n=1 Tax=Piptocephalis cylindrospora TaxID=1907219 RepID=A0A4P9Y7Y9_9FUNG|nr:hypothetical protein BJ684DRAFT_14589 [Piptocephalis cylindrospora]|eukprot:RKP15125.1 hypothetical protein BJ684DRAFT_14589 [Piptocephalis cylindrospora]